MSEMGNSDADAQTTLIEVCEEENNGYTGKSIKELYFFDLAHTRELYKDFDLKIQVLYIMTKYPYGISIRKIMRALGLGGNFRYLHQKVKDTLCFWNGAGLVSILYDEKMQTMPSPMMWVCNDVEKSEEVIKSVISLHRVIEGKAIENNSLERLILANTKTLHCISMQKKTERTV